MNTKKLYDSNATKWARNEPVSLSDFTGRPAVFDICQPITGMKILDLGCGEGYFSRTLLAQNPSSIIGIDISEEMINSAIAQNKDERASFRTTKDTNLEFENEQFDLVVAVFVYNYFFLDEMINSYREVFRVLKPGGRFVFSVPHPFFPFISKKDSNTFHFDFGEDTYFSARGIKADGTIKRRDNIELPVQMCHKTLEDYFDAINLAGFDKMPLIRELRVLPEHIEMDPSFFNPVADLPLHIALRIEK